MLTGGLGMPVEEPTLVSTSRLVSMPTEWVSVAREVMNDHEIWECQSKRSQRVAYPRL